MKRLLTTLTVATSLIAGGAVAFEANLSLPDANRLAGKPMVQDLSVGVKALISSYYSGCILEGRLHLIGHSTLVTDPPDYMSYYETTKQPDGEFTIEYGPNAKRQKELPPVPQPFCNRTAEVFPDAIFYPVKSINGFTDYRSFYIDLINQGYK